MPPPLLVDVFYLSQGERRFYLGAVVDDLFLATPEWVYSEVEDENAVGTRCTYEDMATLKAAQDGFNAAYGSDIHTEFAFNGGGILEKVGDASIVPIEWCRFPAIAVVAPLQCRFPAMAVVAPL